MREDGLYRTLVLCIFTASKSSTTSMKAKTTEDSGATRVFLYLSNRDDTFFNSPRICYLFIGITKYLTDVSEAPLRTTGRPTPENWRVMESSTMC